MSDSEDENYASFGVPLDALDEDNLPRKKPITIADRCAYDSEGRRRFHGAFTGGFSAGYFNGVGSREGWQPRQFKSSRSEKMQSILQRPEDFMDEEDVGEFGIAPQGIRASKDYAENDHRGAKRKKIHQNNDLPIPGIPVLQELVRPTRETIGVVLLRKMGWKPGQGVGCRVSQRQKAKMRQRNKKAKVYGCAPEGASQWSQHSVESNSECSEDDDERNVTFAPDDYELLRFKPKDNYFGIGYTGLNGRAILSNEPSLFDSTTFSIRDKGKKLSIRGQAFGVGAFEADDEDIYEKDDMTRYDFSLKPDRDEKSRWSSGNILEKCPDSTYLGNFVESKKRLERRSVPLPELPRDFVAVHAPRKSRFYPAIERDSSRDKRGGAAIIDSKNRARIVLGENEIISGDITFRSTGNSDQNKLRQEQETAKTEKFAKNDPVLWMEKLRENRFVKGEIVGSTKDVSAEKESEQTNLTTLRMLENKKIDDTHSNVEKQRQDNLSNAADRDAKEAAKMKMFGKLTRTRSTWRPASIVYKRFNIPERMVDSVERDRTGQSSKKPLSIFDHIERRGPLTFSKETFLKNKNETEVPIETAEARVCEPKEENVQMSQKEENEQMPKKEENKQMPIKEENEQVLGDEDQTEKETEFEISYERVFGRDIRGKRNNEKADICEDSGRIIFEKKKEEENEILVGTATDAKIANDKKSQEKKDLFKSIFLDSDSQTDEEVETGSEASVDETPTKSVLIGEKSVGNVSRSDASQGKDFFTKVDLDELMVHVNDRTELKLDEKQSLLSEDINDSKMTSTTTDTSETYGPVLPARLLRNNELDKKQSVSFESAMGTERVVVKSTVVADGKWVEARSSKKKKKQKKKKHKEHKSAKHKHKSKKRTRSRSR